MQQYNRNGHDLGHCVGFAEDAWPKFAAPHDRVQDCRDEQNADVAAKDKYGDRCRHQPLVHQDKKQGTEEELVGDWV